MLGGRGKVSSKTSKNQAGETPADTGKSARLGYRGESTGGGDGQDNEVSQGVFELV